MCLTLRSKTVFVNICPISLVLSNKVISIKLKPSLKICVFSKSLRKNNFWGKFLASFRDNLFFYLKEIFLSFRRKFLKTSEKLSLAGVAHFEEQNCFPKYLAGLV